jgi:hypothetical protein
LLFPILQKHKACTVNFFSIFFFIVVLCGVHCGIYTGSCDVSNISYLNSPPPQPSFIPPFPNSWNSFNGYHFCIYIHVYLFFALFSPPNSARSLPLSPKAGPASLYRNHTAPKLSIYRHSHFQYSFYGFSLLSVPTNGLKYFPLADPEE